MIKSLKDKKYYIGQTKDIEARLKKHNHGLVQSTKSRKPFILIGYEIYPTQKEARWREYQLKHHSDKKEKFIQYCTKPGSGWRKRAAADY